MENIMIKYLYLKFKTEIRIFTAMRIEEINASGVKILRSCHQ